MAGSVKAPQPNPQMMAQAQNDLNSQQSFLNTATGYQTQAANVLNNLPQVSLTGAINTANAINGNPQNGQLPSFLQMNSTNPLFQASSAQDIANEGQSAFFNQEEAPQLAEDAEQTWLGGNMGTSGSSSFGADYLANQQASAQAQATLYGQQYYTNDLNNFLNEASSYNQNYTQPALQAQEFNTQTALNQAQGLAGLSDTSLGQANSELGGANANYGEANFLSNQQLQASAANARNTAQLLTGGAGLLGGMLGLTNGGLSNFLGSAATGLSQGITQPLGYNSNSNTASALGGYGSGLGTGFGSSNSPFGASSFMNLSY